jgi:hypothetical protein
MLILTIILITIDLAISHSMLILTIILITIDLAISHSEENFHYQYKSKKQTLYVLRT